ncbi:SCO family protein [Thiolapillus sp.]
MNYKAAWLVLWLLWTPLLLAQGQPEGNAETPAVTEAPPGGDFALHSSKGVFALKDYRGKVVLLYFGYTQCPDVCPTSLSYLAQAFNELDEKELEKVVGVFVSVDPKRDTPELLDEYVDYFHPNFMGVTGGEKELAEAAARYGAQYYEVELEGSAFGYAVNHSAATYLIAPNGELRFIFPHGTSPVVISEAIRYVLEGN